MSSSIIADDKLKQKCQVFTPPDIVKQMLDTAGYQDGLFGKKVLENSAGNGEILVQIVKRYIESCEKQEFLPQKIKKGLEKDIVAYEIDIDRVEECKSRLNDITSKHHISEVCWNIRCEDYLQTNSKEVFDFIIGNPPYIAYPDLPSEVQTFVKNRFSTCNKGKFDYSYAFIEKSYHSLAKNGVLVYIIPSNIFKNVYAEQIRDLIVEDLDTIIDFPTDQIFKSVLVSPAIIKVKKGANVKTFNYVSNNSNQIISKNTLGAKWIFDGTNESKSKRVGDYYRVSSSVATLLNGVFVIKDGVFQDDYFCFGNYKIEIELLRKAASPRNKKHKKHIEYIIFPYHYDDNGKIVHYSEIEMIEKFPKAMEYLQSHKDELDKRDSDKNAQWFEYGRSQALENLNQQVAMISSIISRCTEVYLLDEGEIPYSGYYIIPKKEMTLSALLPLLNSDSFRAYINSVGVCVNGTSKRITPADVENYSFA